ncbi:MAG: HPr(Ser) kinase/phosphatase [Betaproteobacteria bacterium]|nr:HPr(Ser) kinase/phosphatase [Betaproteobacteria bacterium]
MIPTITVKQMFDAVEHTLALVWVCGQGGGDKALMGDTVQKPSLALVGHLNFVHPNRVQVLGCAEMDYLAKLSTTRLSQAIDNLFSTELAAVIVANGEPVPQALLAASERTGTPLFTSTQASPELMALLSHYLSVALAESVTMHGVMMEVNGIGVMLTGAPAVGKSELALELLTRGHRLVADDVVEVYKVAPDTLSAESPPLLQDFLEVRGIGILNVRALFGELAIKLKKNLRLIVHLTPFEEFTEKNASRLDMSESNELILGVEIPKVFVPVAAGRSLAVLVEVATRNHMLRQRGVNSVEDFIARQQAALRDEHLT